MSLAVVTALILTAKELVSLVISWQLDRSSVALRFNDTSECNEDGGL